MKPHGYEKRRNKRVKTHIKADIYIYSYYNPKFLGKGIISNLGGGGVKFETTDDLDEDEDLLITFFLPNGRKYYNIRSRIARKQKDAFVYSYGLRFYEMKLLDRIRIMFFTGRKKEE